MTDAELKMMRPTWMEVDLGQLRKNIRIIQDYIDGRAEMIGVAKGDGYACGVDAVVSTMKSEGIKKVAVATLAEAVEVRRCGHDDIDVIILGLCGPAQAEIIVENDLLPAVDSYEYAKSLSEAGEKLGKKARGIIAFDTGMGRVGYRWDEDFVSEIKEMDKLPCFEYVGMFTHFCNADTHDKWYVDIQKAHLEDVLAALDEAGIDMKIKSFANSATTQDHPELYYTHVRPGVITYGFHSDDEINKLPVEVIMQVKAQILKVKEIEAGEYVGYGCAFKSERKSKIATISIGYADGVPRIWGQTGFAIVNGVKVPYAGNVCMDQAMLDVTDVPDVKVGDIATIMGKDGDEEVSLYDIAAGTGRLHHEIFMPMKLRMARVYIDE